MPVPADGALHGLWSSAGHGPSLVRAQPGEPLLTLDPPVQPLGVVGEWEEAAPDPVRIGPGGSLVMVSDGIFETVNPAGEQLGLTRMTRHIEANDGRPAADTIGALCSAVREWQGPDEPLDDQTIVVVRRVG